MRVNHIPKVHLPSVLKNAAWPAFQRWRAPAALSEIKRASDAWHLRKSSHECTNVCFTPQNFQEISNFKAVLEVPLAKHMNRRVCGHLSSTRKLTEEGVGVKITNCFIKFNFTLWEGHVIHKTISAFALASSPWTRKYCGWKTAHWHLIMKVAMVWESHTFSSCLRHWKPPRAVALKEPWLIPTSLFCH